MFAHQAIEDIKLTIKNLRDFGLDENDRYVEHLEIFLEGVIEAQHFHLGEAREILTAQQPVLVCKECGELLK